MRRGYTLIEMMLVIVITGVLASILLGCYRDSYRAAREAATKGNLAALRGGIAMYVNNHISYPTDDLQSLVADNILAAIPVDYNYWHPDSGRVIIASLSSKEGGWRYDNEDASVTWGDVWVNCIHTDRKGAQWTAF